MHGATFSRALPPRRDRYGAKNPIKIATPARKFEFPGCFGQPRPPRVPVTPLRVSVQSRDRALVIQLGNSCFFSYETTFSSNVKVESTWKNNELSCYVRTVKVFGGLEKLGLGKRLFAGRYAMLDCSGDVRYCELSGQAKRDLCKSFVSWRKWL